MRNVGLRLRRLSSLTAKDADVPHFWNSFLRERRTVNRENLISVAGKLYATCYVCGPTVYDFCHLGHALNYVRFDLFRRAMRRFCNIHVIAAMGITDIDDKIITKANHEKVSAESIAKRYTNAFLEDLTSLGVEEPDIFMPVTENMHLVVDFLSRLEQLGYAYVNQVTGDLVFDTGKVKDYMASEETESGKSTGKKSPRDFVLWKLSKPGEPSWSFTSRTGKEILGRPGWHVECSAMGTGIFGSRLHFHYGGKDLVFPHNYNESACCHAYHQLPTIDGWSQIWLNTGHLILQKQVSLEMKNIPLHFSSLENEQIFEEHHYDPGFSQVKSSEHHSSYLRSDSVPERHDLR